MKNTCFMNNHNDIPTKSGNNQSLLRYIEHDFEIKILIFICNTDKNTAYKLVDNIHKVVL